MVIRAYVFISLVHEEIKLAHTTWFSFFHAKETQHTFRSNMKYLFFHSVCCFFEYFSAPLQKLRRRSCSMLRAIPPITRGWSLVWATPMICGLRYGEGMTTQTGNRRCVSGQTIPLSWSTLHTAILVIQSFTKRMPWIVDAFGPAMRCCYRCDTFTKSTSPDTHLQKQPNRIFSNQPWCVSLEKKVNLAHSPENAHIRAPLLDRQSFMSKNCD